MSELLEQLRKAVGETNVRVGDAVHADYTHDETLGVTPVLPLALVLPGSTGEVSEVLKVANEHRVPLPRATTGTPRSEATLSTSDTSLVEPGSTSASGTTGETVRVSSWV